MRLGKSIAVTAAVCMAATSLSTPSVAASIRDKTEKAKAEIPACYRNLGTVAVREPDNKWWEGLKLDSPEALIKLLVMRSGCFTVLDRGKGFEMMQQERALAAGGQLQGGANMGGGQMKAADYILVPDIVSKNDNSGGTNVGGLLGGFMGGFAGAIVSGISISSKTADVTLSLGNVRTSEMQAITEGHGDKTDVGFSLGGAGFGGGVFGGAGVGSYANTAIGQVIILAYIDAYTKLVTQLGGISDAPAAQTAPQQTVTLSRPGILRATPDEKGAKVRDLDQGMILYPTGNSEGVWREVSDEVGNKGWVSNASLSLAK
jgi:curli biogenesis system outer membrane secretion channel CsgG